MGKILGIDLGSSSIGWTLRDENNAFKSGVITFNAGMKKESAGYTSPTKDRREARSKRRLLQARRYRKWELLKRLIEKDMVPLTIPELESWSKYKKGQLQIFPENETFKRWLACDFGYQNGEKYKNPYDLRVLALDKKLSPHEFGRALYHLVQRRGYKNIGEIDTEELDIEQANKDSETKKQLERREKEGFAKALQENRTIAEALKKEFLNKGLRARNQYPLRKEYRAELEKLCNAQGFDITRNDSGEYKNDFVQNLWKAIIWQRPLRSQKGNIGRCTIEKGRKRCPVSHPLFEIFRAWQFINTIKYGENKENKENKKNYKFLPQDVKEKLFNDYIIKNNKNVKFDEIAKYLNKCLKKEYSYNYKADHSVATMPICKGLIDIFGETVKEQISELHNYIIGGKAKNDLKNKTAPKIINNKYSVFDLWHALYSFDEIYLKKFAVQKLKIPNKTTKNGKKLNPFVELKKSISSAFSNLSVKVISKIIPFLKEGHLYNEAVLLAKIPDLIGSIWQNERIKILDAINEANKQLREDETIVAITNNLINKWKGLEHENKFGFKDTTYKLKNDDLNEIINACSSHFVNNSWQSMKVDEQNFLIEAVKKQYQEFFNDKDRKYRVAPTLNELLQDEFNKKNINIDTDKLYHHSKKENIYLKNLPVKSDGSPKFPVKNGIEILPAATNDSIKNPMFNKALSILRKLINELILEGEITKDTEIVIELARELNDNNKRIAIEKYQREREEKRKKYREFLEEFKEKEKIDINVDERIQDFELWNEQILDTITIRNDNSGKEKMLTREYILKQKEAIKRYELWMEQKGICMYTGKTISISQLFSNEIDVEHTIPRSLLPDNTMANQTVCYAWYNRDIKKNQIPTQCPNYYDDKVKEKIGTAIVPRLKQWIELKEHYEEMYNKNSKPIPGEDEEKKNKRIQNKHYYKLHLDYWKDKIERFTCTKINDSWVRRQLTDTQIISRYAREFLSTYFSKVKVQKGSVTADYRKMLSFQETDEKNRNKHTHHAIDAAVLTLIPTNSSKREELLKIMYAYYEKQLGQFIYEPYSGFNSQKIIQHIENSVLVVNYEKDKILIPTYKKVRNRGRIVFLKDKKGNYILDDNGNKIPKIAKGDTIRSNLYKQTFFAKIRAIKRDKNGSPLRDEKGNYIFKKGKDEFIFAERVSIEQAKKYSKDIIDPVIKQLINEQKDNPILKDHQGNPIRHVRIKTNAGTVVKERVNYLSKHEYKNYYYAQQGSIPYAALLQKKNDKTIDRVMIPISSADLIKTHKKIGKFNVESFIETYFPEFNHFPDKKILKVGQKVIVLNNDDEYKYVYKSNLDFLIKRMYVITQFSEGNIWLKYHLEAQEDSKIEETIKHQKDLILTNYEKSNQLPEVVEDLTIKDNKERKTDFMKRKYAFNSIQNDFRLKRLRDILGDEKIKLIKQELDKYKVVSSRIENEGNTPKLKLSSEKWNFLLEGYDFDITLSGCLKWKDK